MNKIILLALIGIASQLSFAQKVSFVGTWHEVKYTFKDTLDAGRDLVNENYDEYRSGRKTLDTKWMGLQEGYNANLIYTIIKVKNEYWLIDELNKKRQIVFDSKAKKYFVRLESELFEVRLNPKTNTLLLMKNDRYDACIAFKQKI